MPQLPHCPGKGVERAALPREKKLAVLHNAQLPRHIAAQSPKQSIDIPAISHHAHLLLLQSNNKHVVGTVILKLLLILH